MLKVVRHLVVMGEFQVLQLYLQLEVAEALVMEVASALVVLLGAQVVEELKNLLMVV